MTTTLILEPRTERPAGAGERPPAPPEPPRGGGWDGPPATQPPIRSAALGMLLFLGADLMFFAGLVGAFIVFRVGAADWPPPGQPRLPAGVTGLNTLILLASGVTMLAAWRRIRRGDSRGLVRALALTAALGTTFLAVQGSEWVKLIGFGLTVRSSVYGGIFYTLIGAHGLHVLAAVVWLLVVLAFGARGRFDRRRCAAVQLCGMYWGLVVLLWPGLYGLVYLG
jgi:heme/copper-type cytochrome/quinol oxidase subunit 3